MKSIVLKIILILPILNSCTDYVWNSKDINNFESILNQEIGKDFTQAYPRSGNDNLVNETDILKQYIQDKYDDSSWIVKVDNESNKIIGWDYAYPARCTRIKSARRGQ
jgi:hypothetical protein